MHGWKMKFPFKMVPFHGTFAHFLGGCNLSSCQVGVLALSVFPIIFVTVPQGSSSVLAASYSMAAAETIDPWRTWTKIFKGILWKLSGIAGLGCWQDTLQIVDCDFGSGNIPGTDTTQSLTSKSKWIPCESNELSLQSNYTFACSPWLLIFRRYVSSITSLKYRWWKKSRTTWDLYDIVNNGINCVSTGARFWPTVFPCEPKDIFQNGVSCQRMLWQCDRQHYWFLSYLPLGVMIMANQTTPPQRTPSAILIMIMMI